MKLSIVISIRCYLGYGFTESSAVRLRGAILKGSFGPHVGLTHRHIVNPDSFGIAK